VVSSFIFGGLLIGGSAMQIAVQVPSSLIVALNGLVVVFVVSIEYMRRRYRRRSEAAAAPPEGAALGPGGVGPPGVVLEGVKE
jgi:simple sugar transport system permease protein